MRFLPAIIANFVLLVSALGYGGVLLRLFPLGPTFSEIDRRALTLLAGLGLLGTAFFDIGQISFSRIVIYLILVPGLLLGLWSCARDVKQLRPRLAALRPPLLPALILAAVFAITAVGGLTEPVGDIRMDAIAYHFLGPKVWLRNAVIRPVPDEAFTAFPAIVETQYAALFAIGGDRAPDFFAVISLLGIALITGSLALRSGLSPADAWWVLALIVSMPALYRGAYGGFVDALYSSFLLAAIRIGFDAVKASQWILFGVFCGVSLGTKYTGLIAVPILFAFAAFLARRVQRASVARVFEHLMIACAAAASIGAPWYVRNWFVIGCPIYPPPPLLSRVFVVKYLSPEAIGQFHHAILKMGEGMGRDAASFLLLPFHLSFHPANFLNGAGGIGLAPLALAPFGLLSRSNDWFAKALASFAVLQTVTWFVTEQDVRFLIHTCVLAAIFAVWGWIYVKRTAAGRAARLAGLTICLSLGYGLYMIGTARAADCHAAVVPAFERARKYEEIPFLDSFLYLNTEPSVTKVLVLDPLVPAFYSNKDYVKPVGRWGEQSLPEPNNRPTLLGELSALHVSHVLDVRWVDGQFRLPENLDGLTLVFERDDQRIYRLN